MSVGGSPPSDTRAGRRIRIMKKRGNEQQPPHPSADAGAEEIRSPPTSIFEAVASHSRPQDLLEILRVIADLGSDCAFVVRCEPNGRWVREWAAGTLPTISGVGGADVGPDAWRGFILPEDRPTTAAHVARAFEQGVSRAEYRIRPPDGEIRWIESSLRSVRDAESPGRTRLFGAIRDVTERRSTEEALRKSESQYRTLVEQASDAILVFDPDGQILTSNPAAWELFGLTRERLHARPIFELAHPDELGRDRRSLRRLGLGHTLRAVRRVAGPEGWVWTEIAARRLQDGRIQSILRDITARMKAEEQIRSLAYFDSLTGLPNRELFHQKLEEALGSCRRGGKQLALLFLDVDRFKRINDSLGHSSGDLLLQEMAERLRSVLRGGDSVGRTRPRAGAADETGPISRLGGDEFTILVLGLEHAQDAARVARRVLHALSRPCSIAGHEIFPSASIGLAVWPDDGDTSELLLRAADTAMYAAKNRGGNRYEFFNVAMNRTTARRLELETRLRHALEREEFHLVYQPIRAAESGRVTAAEALLRWVVEGELAVSPDEFIPIAEETGLIVELGRWALATACRQAKAWEEAGYDPIRMSVNISVYQLRQLGIANTVDQILFESGLDPSRLELEITESSILDDHPNVIAAVGQLSERGVGFALDDFGTGYSSLSALQRFPIERLKIDRSFVAGVGENRNDEALASAIVALAKRLHQRVVAEGVESETQARFLRALGCDELQGYLFSHPVDAEAFETFLGRGNPAAKRVASGERGAPEDA